MMHIGSPSSGEEQIPVTKRKPRKPRGKGLRTTTGCAVCRSRHMKCDELKPICGPCAKGNRPCVYKAPEKNARSASARRRSPVERELSSTPSLMPFHIGTPEYALTPTCDTMSEASFSMGWGIPDTVPIRSVPQGPHCIAGSYTPNTASLRWLGMVPDDASVYSRGSVEPQPMPFDYPHVTSVPPPEDYSDGSVSDGYANRSGPAPMFTRGPSPVDSLEDMPPLDTLLGEADWKIPVHLKPHEIPLFERYVKRLSGWIDTFDPLRHFQQLVPQMAMQNEGLMKAILAMAACHMAVAPDHDPMTSPSDRMADRTMAAEYYQEALRFIQNALHYESYNRSTELLVTILILSAYETLSNSYEGWGKHLKGVFWFQRSQELHGESGGIKQAIWWNWLRQDMWSALHERRRCHTSFQPTKTYPQLNQYEMAARVLYLLSQAVNYHSEEETAAGEQYPQARLERAEYLLGLLRDWKRNLPVHFAPLPSSTPADAAFTPVWFSSSEAAQAMQMYHLAHILILAHKPCIAGLAELQTREKEIAVAIDEIGGIAANVQDEQGILTSLGCLAGAGIYARDAIKREGLLRLINVQHEKTRFTAADLGASLQAEWAVIDAKTS